MYIFAPGIAIAKKTHWQLWVTLLSAMASVAGNWLLVPLWGIWGAALATLLASSLFFLCWLSLSQRLYRIPYAWRALLLSSLGFVVCAGAGVQLEAMGLALPLMLLLKGLLMCVLLGLVVVCGLLPLADLRAVLKQLRRRVGGSARV